MYDLFELDFFGTQDYRILTADNQINGVSEGVIKILADTAVPLPLKG